MKVPLHCGHWVAVNPELRIERWLAVQLCRLPVRSDGGTCEQKVRVLCNAVLGLNCVNTRSCVFYGTWEQKVLVI